jgi:hypothetical protein
VPVVKAAPPSRAPAPPTSRRRAFSRPVATVAESSQNREMLQHIRELEECVVDAWPAAETVELEGWLLRATNGFSHRGNSVATVAEAGSRTTNVLSDVDESLALALRIARVEAWYAGHGLPAMFQVGPASMPRGLDEALAERGYRRTAESLLALATPEQIAEAIAHKHGFEVSIGSAASPAWLELGHQAGRLGAHPADFQGGFTSARDALPLCTRSQCQGYARRRSTQSPRARRRRPRATRKTDCSPISGTSRPSKPTRLSRTRTHRRRCRLRHRRSPPRQT